MNLAVPHVVRNYQMQLALELGLERLQPRPQRDDVLSIVGYGPSVLHTWRHISYPVMTLSGAHRFLIGWGIKPDYHADCDPRIHKASFVSNPIPETEYLMASCSHPQTWRFLADRRVSIWHAHNGDETQAWLQENEREACATLRPGPSIGTAALVLARDVLGFRRVRLFGYDSCMVDGALRAGASEAPYQVETPVVITVEGVPYLTTENMKRQAEEFTKYAAGLEYEIVGEGLLKAMLRAKERQAA